MAKGGLHQGSGVQIFVQKVSPGHWQVSHQRSALGKPKVHKKC